MPASTPIYGFPYPLGTDPVGQGAQDIQDLATAVESTLASRMGLVRIASTSSSSLVSELVIDNCFTSQYESYRLVYTLDSVNSDTTRTVNLRYRRSGSYTTTTTGYRYLSTQTLLGSSTYGDRLLTSGGAQSGAMIEAHYTSGSISISLDISFPSNPSRFTAAHGTAIGSNASQRTTAQIGVLLVENQTVDGVGVFPSTGTASGKLTIYGYNQ